VAQPDAAPVREASYAATGAAAPAGGEIPIAQPEATGSVPAAVSSQSIEEQIARLNDLAMEDDTNALNQILAELYSPNPEIRKAALEATVQFSSRDAIPALETAAEHSVDPQEKTAIKEAIEFLKLPSLTEVLQRGGTNTVIRVQRTELRPIQTGPANQGVPK
jgi:HEAT repeat protein